jgi:hypothetical protein
LLERELEIAGEIDRARGHPPVRRRCERAGTRQEAKVVVGEPPALPVRKARPDRPHGRPRPAGEIDDCDRRLIAKAAATAGTAACARRS